MDQLALFDVPSPCSVRGCNGSVRVKRLRLCSPHYVRLRRYGDPTAGGPLRPRTWTAQPVQDFPDGTRLCNTCAIRKPLDEFAKDPSATAGRRSNCKPCHTKRAQDWYAANRERQRSRANARRRADLEKYRRLDIERYERDKPKRIELVVEAGHRRRALLRSAPSDRGITYRALRKKLGDLCHYCGEVMSFEPATGHTFVPLRATVEHLIPLARGGHHTWANTVLACWQCNVRKNDAPLDEWLAKSQVEPA